MLCGSVARKVDLLASVQWAYSHTLRGDAVFYEGLGTAGSFHKWSSVFMH